MFKFQCLENYDFFKDKETFKKVIVLEEYVLEIFQLKNEKI